MLQSKVNSESFNCYREQVFLASEQGKQLSSLLHRKVLFLEDPVVLKCVESILSKPMFSRTKLEMQFLRIPMKSVSFFSELEKAMSIIFETKIFRYLKYQHFTTFSEVFSYGEPGFDVYIILQGEVKLLTHKQSLVGEGLTSNLSQDEQVFFSSNYPQMRAFETKKMGDVIGEISLRNRTTREVSAVATKETSVAKISRFYFKVCLGQFFAMKRDEDMNTMQNCELFTDWKTQEIEIALLSSIHYSLKRGQILISVQKESEPSKKYAYLVLSGKVEIIKNQIASQNEQAKGEKSNDVKELIRNNTSGSEFQKEKIKSEKKDEINENDQQNNSKEEENNLMKLKNNERITGDWFGWKGQRKCLMEEAEAISDEVNLLIIPVEVLRKMRVTEKPLSLIFKNCETKPLKEEKLKNQVKSLKEQILSEEIQSVIICHEKITLNKSQNLQEKEASQNLVDIQNIKEIKQIEEEEEEKQEVVYENEGDDEEERKQIKKQEVKQIEEQKINQIKGKEENQIKKWIEKEEEEVKEAIKLIEESQQEVRDKKSLTFCSSEHSSCDSTQASPELKFSQITSLAEQSIIKVKKCSSQIEKVTQDLIEKDEENEDSFETRKHDDLSQDLNESIFVLENDMKPQKNHIQRRTPSKNQGEILISKKKIIKNFYVFGTPKYDMPKNQIENKENTQSQSQGESRDSSLIAQMPFDTNGQSQQTIVHQTSLNLTVDNIKQNHSINLSPLKKRRQIFKSGFEQPQNNHYEQGIQISVSSTANQTISQQFYPPPLNQNSYVPPQKVKLEFNRKRTQTQTFRKQPPPPQQQHQQQQQQTNYQNQQQLRIIPNLYSSVYNEKNNDSNFATKNSLKEDHLTYYNSPIRSSKIQESSDILQKSQELPQNSHQTSNPIQPIQNIQIEKKKKKIKVILSINKRENLLESIAINQNLKEELSEMKEKFLSEGSSSSASPQKYNLRKKSSSGIDEFQEFYSSEIQTIYGTSMQNNNSHNNTIYNASSPIDNSRRRSIKSFDQINGLLSPYTKKKRQSLNNVVQLPNLDSPIETSNHMYYYNKPISTPEQDSLPTIQRKQSLSKSAQEEAESNKLQQLRPFYINPGLSQRKQSIGKRNEDGLMMLNASISSQKNWLDIKNTESPSINNTSQILTEKNEILNPQVMVLRANMNEVHKKKLNSFID